MHIDREDMLELTRRMTVSRNCFSRIAGAYMDEEGFIDGTFNTHFLKLSGSEKEKNLNIAKTVPYSNTNVNLKNYRLDQGARKPGSIMQLLEALRQCELKNDALLYSSMNILGRDTSRDILMPFIFSSAATMYPPREKTKRTSGSPRKSISFSSARSVR